MCEPAGAHCGSQSVPYLLLVIDIAFDIGFTDAVSPVLIVHFL
jgi:hypothetical protein